MVVNYDKKNGWTTWLDSILDKAPTVSKEIEDMFKKLEKKPNVKLFTSQDFLDFAKQMKIADDNLTEFFKNDKYVEKTFANYQQYLKDTMGIAAKFKKAMSGVGTVIKKIGAAMVTEAVFMAASWAIGKTLEAIDDWIHKSDRLIEKGEKAKQTIADVNSELQEKKTSGKSLIDEYADYIESGKVGVQTDAQGNTTGYTQLTATNEEYEAFLDTNKEIAELFPSLVGGYDSQGNVLLNLGSSAETATAALQSLIEQEERIANFKIEQNMQDAASGVLAEYKKIQSQIKSNEELLTKYNDKAQGEKELLDSRLIEPVSDIFIGDGETIQKRSYQWMADEVEENRILFDAIKKSIDQYNNTVGSIDDIVFNETSANGDRTLDFKTSEENFNAFNRILEDQYSEISGNEVTLAAEASASNEILEAQIKSNLNSLIPVMQSYTDTMTGFLEFSDNKEVQDKITTGINDIISSFDISNMSFEEAQLALSDFQGWINKTFLNDIIYTITSAKPGNKEKIQNAWADLLTLDASSMNAYDEFNYIDQLVKTIFPDDIEKQMNLRLILGYDVETEDGKKVNARSLKENEIAEKLKIDNEILGVLTGSQLEIAYDLVVNDNFTGTFENLMLEIEKAEEKIKASQDTLKTTFSSLLSAEDGDTRKAVDKFEEEAAAIQSAMEKLSSEGRLSNSDWIELQKTLPELAGSTEDLDKVLADLKADKAVKFAEEFGKSIAELSGDKEALQSAVNYFADQIKTLDLPAKDLSLVQDWLVRSITSTSLKDTSGLSKMITEALLMDFDEYLDLSFNTAYETYTSKMATFTDALEQFKAGTLEGDALTELYQKVPELAQTTDDLDVALTKLAMNEIGVMLADLNQQIESCIEAGGDVSPLLKLRETITDAVDPSNYTIEELKDQLYAIPEEARDSMSRDDLELAFKLQLETGQAYSDFDKLTQDIETRKVKLSLEMDNMSMFDDYEEALNGLENGDRWDKYGEILKSAKESYDAGDWGEKQFKEAAKLYSYANDSGAANFAENYERFKDFFQEDTKAGAISFLNFLDEYDYAHFDDALNTWVVDIKDFAQDIFGVEIIS